MFLECPLKLLPNESLTNWNSNSNLFSRVNLGICITSRSSNPNCLEFPIPKLDPNSMERLDPIWGHELISPLNYRNPEHSKFLNGSGNGNFTHFRLCHHHLPPPSWMTSYWATNHMGHPFGHVWQQRPCHWGRRGRGEASEIHSAPSWECVAWELLPAQPEGTFGAM